METCKARKLSLRRLSLNSGLSPGTVYSIIHRKYQPNVYSLNQLADYLRVERTHLWQLAGLIENTCISPCDIRLKSQLARAQDLPEEARNLLSGIIEQILKHYEETTRSPR